MTTLSKKKFLAAFILGALFLAIAPLDSKSENPASTINTSPALSDLAVPEGIGKVQERFSGKSPRTIIQIQDVHAHVVAQQNIAAILERLRVVFGIEQAALEGAWASTSLSKSHAIPTSREKQLLAETLLDDDLLSGPVYAAIMSSEPITLTGIEDEPSYEKNRTLFLTHLEKAKEIDAKLRIYEASLQESEKSIWGPELLAFGNAFGKFRETSDLAKFLPVLLKASETQKLDISGFPQIALVQSIMALEKLLQKDPLEQEVARLMKEYKGLPWTLEELIRGGKIPTEKLSLYPELKKMAHLYLLRDQISLGELMTQIETLTFRTLEKLARTPEEIALWEKNARLCLAKRILLLHASPADIKTYESEKSALEPELAGAGLSEALSLSLAFYDVVKKRDEIFFKRIVNDPALSGNIAIITGGFHTDGLSRRFRNAGISYITITPELGGTTMNEKLYNARMTQEGGRSQYQSIVAERRLGPPKLPFQKKKQKFGRRAENEKTDLTPSTIHPSSSSTLSELRNAIAWIDEQFLESYEVLRQTKDLRKAMAQFEALLPAKDVHETVSAPSKKTRSFSTSAPRHALFPVTTFDPTTFQTQSRMEQLQVVRGWLEKIQAFHGKAMLVSQVSILKKLLVHEKTQELVERIIRSNDSLVLVQDVPVAEVPELFLASRGIKRFEVQDMDTLLTQTPAFRPLAKKFPFAIMKEGYKSESFVVLPEQPVSLILYRIVALNPNLYQAAKNPAFLALLQDLMAEILSQELPKTSV